MDNEVKIDPLCLYDVWLDMALIFNYLSFASSTC